jgi:hypothetical protein
VASAGVISGFDCISRRGRRDDLHRRDERLGSIGVHEQINLGGSNLAYLASGGILCVFSE